MRQKTSSKFAGFVVLFVGAVLALTGCQTGGPGSVGAPENYNPGMFADGGSTNEGPKAPITDDRMQFKPGDTIKVEFSDTELTTIETEIKHDGTIALAIAEKSFKVAGLTPREAETGIRDVYVPRLYRRLTVTVTPGTRFFYVGGQVKQESRFPYSGTITVLKAIQTAGGFTNFANKREVKVIRANGQVIVVDCIKALNDPTLDIVIYPNDQINVKESIL